jgi:hypothetical protein
VKRSPQPGKSTAIAALGTLALHGAVAGWLATQALPRERVRDRPITVELDFSVSEITQPGVESVVEAVPALPETETRTRTRTNTNTNTNTTGSVGVTELVESTSLKPVEAPAPAPVVAVAPSGTEKRKIDLSPLAAALTMRDSFESRGRCGVAPGTDGCNAVADAGIGGEKGAALEPNQLIAMRKELKLEPHSDGSYTYDGASVAAKVLPDGRVEFQDKIRDLNSLVERIAVGGQHNTSEKRNFMQSTAALREQLALAAEAKNQERAKHGLRLALEHLWSDKARSLLQKRAAIFALWDDCASDVSGSAAQGRIEEFVRQHLPEGTPLAYGNAELAQLNRSRVSRRTFEPYARSDAGSEQPG